MKSRYSFFALVFSILIGSSFGFRPSRSTIAMISKIIQTVSKRSESTEWKAAVKGESLISGDHVRTGVKSLALIKFLDNSIVRVREETELQLGGDMSGGGFSKSVNLKSGAFGFDVKKQQNEKFIFNTPTSVASIRGTKGVLSRGDTLVVTEGLVGLKNSVSQTEIDVPVGYIAFSNEDGTITSRKATGPELQNAEREITGGSTNELNLEMKDSKGNKKDLKIKFKQ